MNIRKYLRPLSILMPSYIRKNQKFPNKVLTLSNPRHIKKTLSLPRSNSDVLEDINFLYIHEKGQKNLSRIPRGSNLFRNKAADMRPTKLVFFTFEKRDLQTCFSYLPDNRILFTSGKRLQLIRVRPAVCNRKWRQGIIRQF